MSHPFGDLLSQYRARKHGLSQTKLAEAVGYDHAVIVRMCQGKKDLTGPSGRDRVVRIIGALRDFGALSTLVEANALLDAANMPPLYAGQTVEATLIKSLVSNAPPSAAHGSNLPVPPTPLIGREDDVATAKQHLMRDEVRLLTLLGPPGVGKTRLALQVVGELRSTFDGEAYFVPLAPVGDASFVVSAIAQALGVIQVVNQPLIEGVKRALHDRSVLLALDNFEHVLDAAPTVAELLAHAPNLKLLITSRAASHISAEHEFHVQPLAPQPAVELFVQRARAVKPEFAFTETCAPAVAAICRRLDGLPLAIELAAARLKLFSPEALLVRLEQAPLEMLTDGASDLPPRQRMLRSTIDWSYGLLSDKEQATFRRLSVFAGGFTLEAAEAVTNAPWQAISSLLDKCLIQPHSSSVRILNRQKTDEAHFTMLEMLREYALEKLDERGELEATRRRHADFFIQMAEAAELPLLGDRQIEWLRRLSSNHDNLRAALKWAQDRGEPEITMRLIGPIWRYWQTGTRLGEGRLWLKPALSAKATTSSPPRILAKAYHAAGALAIRQGDIPEAHRMHAQGATWAAESEDDAVISLTLGGLTAATIEMGELENVWPILGRALKLARETGNRWNYAVALSFQGWLASLQGDYERALALNGEARPLLLEVGDRYLGMGIQAYQMGRAAELMGDKEQAKRHFLEGLTIERELGPEFAEYQFVSAHLSGLGRLAAAQWRPLHMAKLCGSVEGLAERVGGVPREAVGQIDQQTAIAKYSAATGESVDEQAFAAAWAEGRVMTLEQAIEYALGDDSTQRMENE